MMEEPIERVVPPYLTPDEHVCAQVTAYYIALTRSDGRTPPPFNSALVKADFLHAAGLLVDTFRGVDGILNGTPILHEPDPTGAYRGRPLPIALRRYPILDSRDVALQEFVRLQNGMSDWEYWSLLGHIWVFSNKEPGVFNHRYSQTYGTLFTSGRTSREQLMTPQERAKLSVLENPLTVFRGCQTGLNENGLSWSRDRKVAEWFAFRYYPFGPRSILRGTCNPSQAIAYFDYADEKEVVIWSDIVAGKMRVDD